MNRPHRHIRERDQAVKRLIDQMEQLVLRQPALPRPPGVVDLGRPEAAVGDHAPDIGIVVVEPAEGLDDLAVDELKLAGSLGNDRCWRSRRPAGNRAAGPSASRGPPRASGESRRRPRGPLPNAATNSGISSGGPGGRPAGRAERRRLACIRPLKIEWKGPKFRALAMILTRGSPPRAPESIQGTVGRGVVAEDMLVIVGRQLGLEDPPVRLVAIDDVQLLVIARRDDADQFA